MIRVIGGDPPVRNHAAIHDRFATPSDVLYEVLAGPEPTPGDRVRAATAVGALWQPLAELPELELKPLWADLVRSSLAALESSPPTSLEHGPHGDRVAGPVITPMLVEDHASFRAALEAVFGLQDDLRVVAQVGRGEMAGEVAAEQLPDVVIVDLDLPGGDGVDALEAVRRTSPDSACLVLTALSDDVELGRAIEAGAAAIVHKSAEMSELLAAIRAVAPR